MAKKHYETFVYQGSQFIGSLSRECNKAKEIKKGVSIFSNSQLFKKV